MLTKYATVVYSRSIVDIRESLKEIIFSCGVPRIVVVDNLKSIQFNSILFTFEDQLNIKVFKTSPYKSETISYYIVENYALL